MEYHYHFDADLTCTKKTCTNRDTQPPTCQYEFEGKGVVLAIRHTDQNAWSVGDTFSLHLMPTGPTIRESECSFVTRWKRDG